MSLKALTFMVGEWCEKKSIISSTLSQLVDSGHFIEKTKSFRVMYFML